MHCTVGSCDWWEYLVFFKVCGQPLLHTPAIRAVQEDGKNVYHQTSNIWGTLTDDKIVDHTDVFGALPVGAAPTTSSFST